MSKLLPCPFCHDSWLYVSDNTYSANYECKGIRVDCLCGFAWKSVDEWYKSREEAISAWNKKLDSALQEKKRGRYV